MGKAYIIHIISINEINSVEKIYGSTNAPLAVVAITKTPKK